MSDIGEMVAWLRGVLDADERGALAVSDGPNKPEKWTAKQYKDGIRNWRVDGQHSCVVDGAHQYDAEHIARHDPVHELNVVAAHRLLLDLAGDLVADAVEFAAEGDAEWMRLTSIAQYIRRTLAAGYAGRDGYRAEWGHGTNPPG